VVENAVYDRAYILNFLGPNETRSFDLLTRHKCALQGMFRGACDNLMDFADISAVCHRHLNSADSKEAIVEQIVERAPISFHDGTN
jgi:hypothetical protein